jgi:hypothetical protein
MTNDELDALVVQADDGDVNARERVLEYLAECERTSRETLIREAEDE